MFDIPPLIWRERISVCPLCAKRTVGDQDFCPHCGAEFEAEPEQIAVDDPTRDKVDFRTASFMAAMSSVLTLFLIVLFLDHLHQWVPPIQTNLLTYAMLTLAGFLIAFFAYREISARVRAGKEKSRAIRALPYSMMMYSAFAFAMFLLSGSLDKMITNVHDELVTILGIFLIVGIVGHASIELSRSRAKH